MKKFLFNLVLMLALCVPWAHGQTLFYEGFESTTGSSLPTGWTNEGTKTWTTAKGVNASHPSTAYQGNRNAQLYAGDRGYTSKLITPTIDCSGNPAVKLTFAYVNQSWSGDIDAITVYYRTDVSDSWHQIDDITSAHSVWTLSDEYVVSTSSSSTFQLAFECNSHYGYGVGIDDVTVLQGPSCFNPTALTVSNITSASADISWSASGQGETQYQYIGVTSGSTPDWSNASTPSTSTSCTVNNLTPNTSYDVYVRSYCSESDQSYGAKTSFRTACAALQITASNPYTYGFEDATAGSYSNNYADFIPCWGKVNNSTSTEASYKAYPYAYAGTSYSHSGNNCVYFYACNSTSYPSEQILVFPEVTNSVNGLALSFWAKMSSQSYPGVLQLGVMTDPADATTFVKVGDDISLTTTYSLYELDLTTYAGEGHYVAIRCPRPTSYSYQAIYFDDVELSLIPPCRPLQSVSVSDITRTSLRVNWQPYSGVTNCQGYQVLCSTSANPDLATETPIDVNSAATLFLDIDNLERDTTYYVYVRSYCGSEDGYSEWASTSATTKSLNDCSNAVTVADGTNTTSYFPFYGLYQDTRDTKSQFIYGSDMLTELRGKSISKMTFYSTTSSSLSYTGTNRVSIGITSDNSFSGAFKDSPSQVVFTGQVSISGGLHTIVFDAPFEYPAEGGNLLIEYHLTTGGNCPTVYFYGINTSSNTGRCRSSDYQFLPKVDFGYCEPIEACPAVTDVTVSNVAQTTATISWTASMGDYANDYDVLLSTTPVTDFSSVSPQYTALTATTLNLTDLNPYTDYYAYVRVNCNAREHNDGEAWSEAATFKTLSNCVTPENLTATVLSKTTAKVEWDHFEGQAMNYRYILSTEEVANPDSETPTAINIDADSLILPLLEPATTYYFYLSNDCGSSDGFSPYISTSFTMPEACIAPTNVNLSNIQKYQMTLNWTPSPYADETDTYDIIVSDTEILDFTGTVPTYTGVSGDSLVLNTLQRNTTYYVYIRTNCGEDLVTDWSTAVSATTTFDLDCSNVVTCGTGTASAYLVNTGWGNTHSQHIYTASELNNLGLTAGSIAAVEFDYSSSSSSYDKEQSVYIGTTTKNAFSSSSDYVPSADLTLVYGPERLSYPGAGWYRYEFAENFVWDGVSNIVIGVTTNQPTGTSQSGSSGWNSYGTDVSVYRTVYRYQDNQQINVNAIGSLSYKAYATTRPNIKFVVCNPADPCPALDAAPVASNVEVTTATLTWNEGEGDFASSYDVYFSDEEMSDPSAVVPIVTSLNTTTYNLTGLDPNTHYYAYVRVNCVNENYYDGSSLWSPAGEFTTELPCRRPTDFADTRIYAHAVDLAWVNVSNASAWQVGIVGTSDTSWQDVVNPTISNDTVSYHLTGLTASTPYHFLLRANCSASGEGFSAICLNEVNITTISDANAITAFSFSPNYPAGIQMENAVIDTDNHTINVTVLAGTNLTALTPIIFTNSLAPNSIKINDAFYTSGPIGPIDFSNLVVVTVYAQDTTITQNWTITVQHEACATPVNLSINNVERRKMTLNWTLADTTITNFDLVVSKTEITDLTTATPQIININVDGDADSYSYTVEGLTRGTQYYIYIRSHCGSAWTSSQKSTLDLRNCNPAIVADGTQNNQYVPVYGYYTDAPQRSQSIYPAAMLTDLVGKNIGSMKYFVYSGGSMGSYYNWESKSFNVKLAVTNQENLSSSWATDDMTTVYNGTLSANTTNGMTITFDQPFAYNGGNLLVEFELPVRDGYASCSFYGETATGGSRYYYEDDPYSYLTSGTVQDFLPKVQFSYVDCVPEEACPAVDSAYAELTGEGLHTATVHWTASTGDYANTYDVVVSETEISVADLETRTPDYPAVNALSQDLSELDPYTIYYVYVRANCDGEGQDDGSSTWYGFNFRTNAACHVPHDLAAELTNTNAVEITWTNDQDNNFRYILSTTQVALENLEAAPKTGENLNATSVSFDNLAYETDYYFYLSNACGGSDGNSPWDSVSFTTLPQCNGVTDLVASDTASNSVRLTWSNGQFCNATSWQVTATDATDNVVYDRVATDTTTLVFGLTPETAYTLAVRAICGAGDIAAAATATITTTAVPENCQEFIAGNSTETAVPVYSNYKGTYSIQIYTAEELAAQGYEAGDIESIAFYQTYCNYPTTVEKYRKTTTVWMGNVSKDVFTSSQDWITSGLTEVMSATPVDFNKNGDWVDLTLDNPFTWDGTSNIAVAVLAFSNGYAEMSFRGYEDDYSGTDASRSIISYADGSSWTVTGGVPSMSYKYNGVWRANIKFCFAASSCNKVTNIVAENVTVNSADISWTPGGSETSWNVYNSATELDADDLAALTATDYTTVDYPAQALSGLNVDADYYCYVQANCSATDTSDWKVFHFITLPSCSAPLTAVASNDAPDTLTFVVSAGQYGTAESYNYEYWTVGTTAAENGDTVAFAGTDTVAVAVAPFQTYGWRVKANCGTSDGSSRWTDGNPVYVCGVFHVDDSTAFTEGFEDPAFVSTCWTNQHISGPGTLLWTRYSYTNHTGSASAQLPDMKATTYTDLATPILNVPVANDYEVSFWMYRESTSKPNEGVKVWVNTTPDTVNGTPLMHIRRGYAMGEITETTSGWYQYRAPIPMKGNLYVIFQGISEYGSSSYMDDISVNKRAAYSVSSTPVVATEGSVLIAGDTNSEGKYFAFDTVTLTATAADHYHFHHWTTGDDTISIVNPLSFVPTKDTVLNAVFAIDTFTVTLAVNDTTLGTADGDSVYTYGSTATLTAEAIDHYHFRDWTDTSANVVSTGNPATITVECDTMLIANFAIDTHRLALSVMPLSVMGTVADVNGYYNYGDSVNISATPNYGYFFTGWSDNDTVNERRIAILSDTAIAAQFDSLSYNITALTADAVMGTVTGSATQKYLTSATIEATPTYGYHFVAWNDGSTINPRSFIVERDTTFTATFDSNIYNINVVSADVVMGEVTGSTAQKYLTTATIEALPNYGYYFVAWNDGNTDNPRTINVLRDSTFTASFDSNTYTITVESADVVMGTVTGSADQKYLTTATIEATPEYGYHFVAWNDGNTDNPRTFIVESDTTFTASFDSNIYNINVVSADVVMGEVTGSTAQKYLTTATIEALPNYGYYFVAWNDGNTDNPRTINVLRDSTFTASFDSNTYTITVESADIVMGTVTGSADQKYLTTATIEATPTYGYHFVAWNDGNTDNPRTFIVESDTSFTASFDSNIYKVNILADLDEEGQPKGDVFGSGSFKYLSQVPISVEQRLGFYFLNWSDGDVDAHRTITVTKDTTITAMFSIQPVWVVATSCDTVMGSVTPRQNILDSLTATISATAKYGYHFVSWNDGVTDNPRTLQVVSDTAFSALFDYNQYDITVASANPVMGSVAGTATKNYLAVDTISATSNYGYHFTQWNDGNTDNPRYVTVQRDSIFTASFDNNTYSVAVLHDTVMGTIENVGEHRYLDNVTLTAVPKVGYHLDHWDNGSENAVRSFVITCDTSFTFTFAPNVYDLSVSADNDVKGSVSGSGTYNYNTNASIAAVANYGYEFHGWNDGINANPRTVNVVSDTNFVALFDTVDFTITALAAVSTMGSVEGSGNYAYLSSATLTATPNYGYHFTQWSDGDTNNPRTVEVTAAATYTAQFATNDYVLTVNGDEVMGSATGTGSYAYNTSAILAATANYGYHFTQWNDGNTTNPRTVTVERDSTFTAQFAANNYNVAVASDNNVMGSVAGAGSYTYNTSATISATANYGYHFTQWNDGSTVNPRTLTVVCDSSFTAQFATNDYVLTVNGDEVMGSATGTGSYAYSTNATLAATANYGYHFTQWNDGNTTNPRTVTVERDSTFTAQFAANSYNVAVASDNNVMGSVAGAGSYTYNTSATISATANYGYHFTQWNDGSTVNPRTFTVTCDSSFTAQFAANDYILTVNGDEVMGSATGTGSYAYNTNATLTATANYGYHFTQWNDGNTDNPRTVVVTEDATFTAQFAANNYNVAVASDNNVMGSVAGAGSYTYNTSATISATANYGYHFTQWNDGSTVNPRTFTVTCDSSFTAQFAANDYVLTVNGDAVMGSATGTGSYAYNTNATLAATANYGYHFTQWNDGNTDNPRTVVVTEDATFTAQFAANSYNVAVASDNNVMGSVAGAGSYTYNTSATISATANYGYHFTQWSDGSTVNPRTFTVTCDSSFTAQFAANTYNLTLLADEVMGSVTGAGDFEYNASTIISASANYGYHFTGWSDGVSLNPRMITVTMDSTITALFAANAYHVAASVNIDEAGYVTGAADYQFLDQATLTATATPCYHFVSWNDGVVDNPRTIVVESDTAFTALFELNVYESEFTEVACDSYSWNNDVYTISGDYQHVYSTVNGCDSTVTLHLTVNYSDEGEFSDQASDLYVWDGREYTESGDYTFVYQNVYGCDSTMTLHLTIANFPTPLISQVNNRSLMVNHYPYGNNEYVDYADYRWYRNGELVASGSDNYLEASGLLNGCYTLEVPVNADKSVWVYSNELCFQNGVLVGIEDADAIEISFTVAPNPVAKGAMMTISTELPEHMLQGATLTMFDLSGRIITSMPMTQQSVSMTADQASGVYMIQIMTRSGEKQVKKVIVR